MCLYLLCVCEGYMQIVCVVYVYLYASTPVSPVWWAGESVNVCIRTCMLVLQYQLDGVDLARKSCVPS